MFNFFNILKNNNDKKEHISHEQYTIDDVEIDITPKDDGTIPTLEEIIEILKKQNIIENLKKQINCEFTIEEVAQKALKELLYNITKENIQNSSTVKLFTNLGITYEEIEEHINYISNKITENYFELLKENNFNYYEANEKFFNNIDDANKAYKQLRIKREEINKIQKKYENKINKIKELYESTQYENITIDQYPQNNNPYIINSYYFYLLKLYNILYKKRTEKIILIKLDLILNILENNLDDIKNKIKEFEYLEQKWSNEIRQEILSEEEIKAISNNKYNQINFAHIAEKRNTLDYLKKKILN